MQLIGREREIALLKRLYNEDTSHFVAVYGRRRIGKTFLIRNALEYFEFYHTGIANVNTFIQLQAFATTLQQSTKKAIPNLKNWFDAFEALKVVVQSSRKKKKVIFIDELPWLDTARSNFLPALEHFWNSWASARKDILFIICGSATSWIVKKIFNNKGGLHNRVTQKIKLQPFNLYETSLFLKSKGIKWEKDQITKAFMAMGGVPFYLNTIAKGQSIDQVIEEQFFKNEGLLFDEYENLYASLFKNAENYIEVVQALATKNRGLTRLEIMKIIKKSSGGSLTQILNDLILSDFIKVYTPYNKLQRNSVYQLIDCYSLFYHNFLTVEQHKITRWQHFTNSPKYYNWCGYAFEILALHHIEQIKKALGVSAVQCAVSSWRSQQKSGGAQIDLVLERSDHIIHLFEIKHTIGIFEITKKYATNLQNKLQIFLTETQSKETVFLSMLTNNGVKENSSFNLIQNSVTASDLYEKL